MAIFKISLGWMVTPRLIQRFAPFLVMPNRATAISRVRPSAYSGTANRISRCGGTWATTNMMKPAISMLRPWSTKRVPWSNPDEYMVSKPAQASMKTANASGPSKPRSIGAMRCQSERFPKTTAMARIIPRRRGRAGDGGR